MPKDVFQLSKWTDAPNIINEIDPDLLISVSELPNNQGYVLTVYKEINCRTPDILYCVRIDSTLENTWSLDTPEAIEMLNMIGFSCEWIGTSSISATAYDQLVSLSNLGWTKIRRSSRPEPLISVYTDESTISLKDISEVYNYSDWMFLTEGIEYSISELISHYIPVNN
jgi:hypothetical protein